MTNFEIALETIRAASGLREPTEVHRIHAQAVVTALAEAGRLVPDAEDEPEEG